MASYWNSDTALVESITDALCGARVSVAVDAVDLPHIFSNHNSQIYENIRYPEGWSGGMNVSQSPNGAAQQDVAVDAIGNLHLVWLDGRDGNYEIYYASKYDCSGVSLSPIAQVVYDKLKLESEQNFCGNNIDKLIILPLGQPAFEQYKILAETAEHEISFTTMIWEEGPAGNTFLAGIKFLDDKVHSPDYTGNGIHIRILVGLKTYVPFIDQRAIIMQQLDDLEVRENDSVWTVEVASYRNPDEYINHSHVKTMIVDGKTVIVSGYNVQNNYLEDERRDMGVQVSGPIAINALQVFDGLWVNAEICEQNSSTSCISDSTVEDISHGEAILQPIAKGNDIAFSLFRDDIDKTSDDAIVAAINAANDNVNIMQNRFTNYFISPMPYARAVLDVLQKGGEQQVRINLLVSGSLEDMVFNGSGICDLEIGLVLEDFSKLQYLNVRKTKNSMHTKALSIDNKFVIVGSQNFDQSAWEDDATWKTWGDLAEYNLGIDNQHVASDFNSHFYDEWAEDYSNSANCLPRFGNISLQDAVNQAEIGSTIFIPAGVYSESVTINKPIELIGVGGNQTIIQPANGQPAFRITSSDVIIANIKISGGDGYGIELIDSSPSSLKNINIYRVVFENNKQGGVLVQGLIPGSPMNYTIGNSTFIGGGSGVTINMLETQIEPSLIRNNIFYGQLRFPIEIISDNDSNVEYSYNLFDNCDSGACAIYWRNIGDGTLNPLSSQHDNLFDLEPLFINFEKGAYQLSTDSPAIDAGGPALTHELDYDGNNDGIVRIDIGAFEYVPIANLAPVVSAGPGQSIELGESAVINAVYSDEDNAEDHSARIDWGGGSIEDVVVNPTAPNQGEVIGTHTYTDPGTYTIEVCVTDSNGGVGCDTMSITVSQQFAFTGFFPPVDNQPTLNTVKAGSAVPIKFSLNGYQGLDIFFAGYPASAVVTCGSAAEDAIEQTMMAGGSSLSYNAGADQYIYIWKTDKSWANTCRTFVLRLRDGSYYRADFKFK